MAADAFLAPGTIAEAVFLTAVPILLGVVVRVRRSGERQLAEQELRHSDERALLEERQRIARELHDVVAHHMSVIAIQAEAAPYKTADPPPELVESFGDIRASALEGQLCPAEGPFRGRVAIGTRGELGHVSIREIGEEHVAHAIDLPRKGDLMCKNKG